MRKLIKEIKVMSRDEIVPTYRLPHLVRALSGSVELIDRCANRALSGCPPISLVEVRPAG
jgi:hypothetical protein